MRGATKDNAGARGLNVQDTRMCELSTNACGGHDTCADNAGLRWPGRCGRAAEREEGNVNARHSLGARGGRGWDDTAAAARRRAVEMGSHEQNQFCYRGQPKSASSASTFISRNNR